MFCKEGKWCGTASVSRVAPIAAHVWLLVAAKAALPVFEELNQKWPIAAHDWLVATAKTALQVSEELYQTWPIAAHDWLVYSCGQGLTASLRFFDDDCCLNRIHASFSSIRPLRPNS